MEESSKYDQATTTYLLLEPELVKSKFDITNAELEALRTFKEYFHEEVVPFIEDFYAWMQNLPEFGMFFTSSATLDHVKAKQIKYWQEVFSAEITPGYLKNRENIGLVHARIGLPLHSYCISMNHSAEWWKNKAIALLKDPNTKNPKKVDAAYLNRVINKLIQIDMTVVTETYHKSTQNQLIKTLDDTKQIVDDVTKVAAAVVNGDYSTRLSDSQELSRAINKMIEALSNADTENKRDAWIKNGQAELAEKLRGDLDVAQISANVINFLAVYIEAQVGTFYLLEDNKLHLIGSYAYRHRRSDTVDLNIGEGLIGQAVLEKQVMIVDNLPEDYLTISSSLGESSAKSIIIAPIVFEDRVMGVLELGTMTEFKEIHLKFVETVNESIAVALMSGNNRAKMKELLDDSRKKSDALEEQQQELEKINKNLQEQADEIRASEEELKAQSEELQAINEELEEKTQALENQKRDIEEKNKTLEHSKKMVQEKAEALQKSTKYKSEFLSNMSHELRTPLNSLLILAQSLADNEDNSLSKEQVEKAQVIYSSGQDLLNLINDILDLSKVEAGKLQVEFGAISPKMLGDTVCDRVRPLAEAKNLNFEVVYADDCPDIIVTDGRRVEQVLKNLLSNAIKFTDDKGTVSLKVSMEQDKSKFTTPKLAEERVLSFAVSDTGIGISDADQKEIFEAFQQADGSTNRNYGGTGLGLTISRQLAQLLSGEIHLHSELGKGSTFTLYLPMSSGKEGEATVELSNYGATQAAASSIPSEQFVHEATKVNSKESAVEPLVLIIEDDENFRDILITCLNERRVPCITAATAAEGMQLIKTKKPTGVILDVGLPDRNGLDLLDEIRMNPSTQNVPVHIVTGYDVKEKSMEKGAVGYVSKPVKKDELIAMLDKASSAISEPIKEVLIVEDDNHQLKSIEKLIASDSINVTCAQSVAQAEQVLHEKRIHCMVLDLGLPDGNGKGLLEKISKDKDVVLPAIIVHTAKSLTEEEEKELAEYSPTIVVKTADAPQRLLDEVNLFLHKISEEPNGTSPIKRKTLSNNEIEGRKILLVDDDMRNNIALGSYLREHGLKTVTADNGELAIEYLEKEKDIDLVLMDIMMPVKDGYETIAYIRKQKQYKDLPIIALTAKAMSDERQKCINVGANDYLTKPVDLEKLFDVMKVWLYK